MDDAPPELNLMRFSTDVLPPGDRFEAWRDILSRKLLHAAMDQLSDQPFRAEAALRILPGLRVGSGVIGATLHQRTRSIVSADNDDVALLVNLSGPFVIQRRDVDLQLAVGDACLVDCGETGAFVRAAPGRLLCIRVPRAAVGRLAPRLDDAMGRLIPGNTGALRLLVSYVGMLHLDEAVELTAASSRVVVNHVAELMALLIGADAEGAAMAATGGLRAARLGAVKAYIREHLGAVNLSIEDVAVQQRVSPRYVRKLFEGEGASFSTYVAGERLAQARAILANPRLRHVPISTIAFDVGFGDLSYFNRLFRRRYQATPSDIRAATSEDRARMEL
jgi:AraC-like DNA-binding protein